MIHGGVLNDTGELRADVMELVNMHDPYFAKGYASGRRWVRTRADDYRPLAHDNELLELLASAAEDYNASLDEAEKDLAIVLGSLLGDLSCHLFPFTRERETELLPIVQAVEQPC